MRIKVDEDLPEAATQMLRRRGHQALGVIEQGMGGTKDPDLWRAIQAEHRFLVTADKGFGDIRSYPPGTRQGVLLLRPDELGFGRCSIFSNGFSLPTLWKPWKGRSSSPRHEAFVCGGPRPEGVPSCWVPYPCGIEAPATLQQPPRMGSPRVFCEHFVLIGAMNPCPCGYCGDPVQERTCSNAMVSRYQAGKRHPADSFAFAQDRLGLAVGPRL